MRIIQYLAMILLFISTVSARAEKKVTIITMEVPPFMSSKLPDQGAAIYALRQVFAKAGYELEVQFIPVPRIRASQLANPNIHGFFPSFIDEKFDQNLTLSKEIYRTPWVIVERKDNPIVWNEAQDLLKYKGGNVAGYILRSQVAAAYEKHKDKLESATNDSANILKLIFKRVDFIFIDQNAFKYITATNQHITPHADKLQINAKVVAYNKYGVGFKNDKVSQKILADFNKVADEKIFTEFVSKYMAEHKKKDALK